MAGRERVAVEGLAQFRRALRVLDKEAAKGLRVAMNEAADVVVQKARPLIPTRTGKARASLKAASSQGAARVSMGGNKAPYMPWLDFGGRTGPARSVRRPFLSAGRYLYPTLQRNRDEFSDVLESALTDVARSVGLEVG